MKKILNSIHPDDDLHYEKNGTKKRCSRRMGRWDAY